MEKTVSAIIPTFNRAQFLKKAVESVLVQTFKDFELIIVDDGSQDKTCRIISSYKSDKITYIRQRNRGPAAARNTGITASRGEFIAFLDSDDWWDEDKLAIQISQMQKNPSYLISHTQELWYKNGGILNQKKKHKKFHGYIFDRCLALCAVGMSTIIAARALFEKIGLFDESLPCCEDYDLWLRASIKYPFLLIDKPLTLKNGGRSDQVSSMYATGMDKFRIKAITKILEQKTGLSRIQRRLAVKELLKKCLIYGNGCMKHGKVKEGRYYLELADFINCRTLSA